MASYKNSSCLICNNDFNDNDDIVVCPECGAPYHRKCFNKQGDCIYKNLHGTENVNNLPHNCNRTVKYKDNEKICPNCNSVVLSDAFFCNKCGYNFAETRKDEKRPFPGLSAVQLAYDPMGGVDPNENLNDVKAGDIAKFVKTNTSYYMPVFKNIYSNNKCRFNFSAFIFPSGWFLYRKIYKVGAIITALTFLTTLISSFIDYVYSQNILNSLLASVGITNQNTISSVSYENLMFKLNMLDQNQKVLLFLPSILWFVNLIIMFISGIMANKIYFKHCINKVKSIKNQDEVDLTAEKRLFFEGGVNVKILLLIWICNTIISILPGLIMK